MFEKKFKIRQNLENVVDGILTITLKNGKDVIINTIDNSNMEWEDFAMLCAEGHADIFDLSSKGDWSGLIRIDKDKELIEKRLAKL